MGFGEGWACIGIQFNEALATGRLGMQWDSKRDRPWLQVGPRGAGSGRVGSSRAEWAE